MKTRNKTKTRRKSKILEIPISGGKGGKHRTRYCRFERKDEGGVKVRLNPRVEDARANRKKGGGREKANRAPSEEGGGKGNGYVTIVGELWSLLGKSQ